MGAKLVNRLLVCCVVVSIVSACTTDRVTTEFDALSKLARETNEKLGPILKPKLDEAVKAEFDASAAAGDLWFLSDDCTYILAGDTSVPASNCIVEKVVIGNRKPFRNEAISAQRKMTVLTNYVSALSLLMDAKLEEDVAASYSLALTSLAGLATASEASNLSDFLQERSKRKSAETAVVSEIIATFRYSKMRDAVLKAEPSVSTIARELQLHLVNLGVDGDFEERSRALRDRNMYVLGYDVETQGAAGYKSAVEQLQKEHASFMQYYQRTMVYHVGMIARVHSTLAAALRSSGSAEEVVEYLESLRTLQTLIKQAEGT